MQQMSSAQIVSASAMHPAAQKMGLVPPPPAVTYGSPFWSTQFPHQTPQDVKPFAQSPFLDKPISSPSSMPPGNTPVSVTSAVTSAALSAAAAQGINSLIP